MLVSLPQGELAELSQHGERLAHWAEGGGTLSSSPDGQWILQNSGSYELTVRGRGAATLVAHVLAKSGGAHWSPDTSRFAYFVRAPDQHLELHVVRVDTLEDRALLRTEQTSGALRKIAWAADGAYLAWATPAQGLVIAATDGSHLVSLPTEVKDYVF